MKSIVFIIYALILAIIKPEYGQVIDYFQLGAMLAIVLVVIATHIFFVGDRNWARIDTLFIISYFAVNFQWPAAILISGIFPSYWKFNRLTDQYLMYTTWMAAFFFAIWLAGYWVPVRKIVGRFRELRNNKWVPLITAGLFFLFIALAGLDYLSGKIYRESVEGVGLSGSVQGVAAYVYLLYQVFVIVMIAKMLYDNRATGETNATRVSNIFLKKRNVLPIGIVLAGLFYFMVAGERGQVIQMLCALALGFGGVVKPVPLKSFVSMIVVGALAMTYLRYARAGGSEFVLDDTAQLGMWEFTDNLAKSLYATYVGMDVVEANSGAFHGMLWMSNLLGIVPFAQSVFLKLTELSIQDISGPAAITTYAYGANPTSGLGTTLVVDLYMNCGVVLAMPIIALYGWVCRRFQIHLSGTNGPLRFIAAVSFASLAVYIPRASLFTQLQPVVWGLIVAFVFLRARFNRKS